MSFIDIIIFLSFIFSFSYAFSSIITFKFSQNDACVVSNYGKKIKYIPERNLMYISFYKYSINKCCYYNNLGSIYFYSMNKSVNDDNSGSVVRSNYGIRSYFLKIQPSKFGLFGFYGIEIDRDIDAMLQSAANK